MMNLYIDTGGTFTDCIGVDDTGREYRLKVLSNSTLRGSVIGWHDLRTPEIAENWDLPGEMLQGFRFLLVGCEHDPCYIEHYDREQGKLKLSRELPAHCKDRGSSFAVTTGEEAPVLGARILTRTPVHKKLPPLNIKLGSTRGTNALLEKKGAPVVLFVTRGFRDILHIGNQQRPDIFAMNVVKPQPVNQRVVEVEERVDATGRVLRPLNLEELEKTVDGLRAEGFYCGAVAFMNAYRNLAHERQVRDLLREKGFAYVTASTDLSGHIKYLQRTETTAVNAYLSPVIRSYLDNILSVIEQGQLHIMTSAGGLVHADAFHPKDSLLSGPAGGVVGASRIGLRSGYDKLISFDMGGTSTDVSRYDRQYEYLFELKVGEAQIFSPAIAIETVAAGGGSLCYFDGFKLCVGPGSAGAYPGPACYGAGGPLCITDINLLAGRLDIQRFGIPVYRGHAERRLNELIDQIRQSTGEERSRDTVIQGFLQIANEIMAGAIKKISVAKGYDPAGYAMVAFGGAGGLHACSIAELLSIPTILVPADAGLLSAYGIRSALIERFREQQVLQPLEQVSDRLPGWFAGLDDQAIRDVSREGIAMEDIEVRHRNMFLRFQGQDSSVDIDWRGSVQNALSRFRDQYERIYGYWPEERTIEVESVRVIASVKSGETMPETPVLEEYSPEASHRLEALTGEGWEQIPVYDREQLKPGAKIGGPAVMLDRNSTTYVNSGWQLCLDGNGTMEMHRKKDKKMDQTAKASKAAETELELFTNRFMYIAENMGAMLQRTSLSVNVKERLDFSCALLDAGGNLVANAPHIPVHLGSLGVCVRELKKALRMEPGDVVITNHPRYGGSHLPDITLVSPVHDREGTLVGFVVNRAHHAEMGGITPASMPPHARSLAEEGVVIAPTYLVSKGQVRWDHIRKILTQAPHPSRKPGENLADLHAALAANRTGEAALLKLVAEHGTGKVQHYMGLLKKYAEEKIRLALREIADGNYQAEEKLDDGSRIKVLVTIEGESCTIDFSGTSGVHPGNLNATYAIVNSVVIYVLRLLVDEPIPLNDGLFQPVELVVPYNLLNPEFRDDPRQCPAIVGGNVEVSQRLTDTLLKAFGLLACSQGTMNNLMFGNEQFSYYETICGGCGAGNGFHGASAVHHHMTNTRITDPEILEHRYPVRLDRFVIRPGSGGKGKFSGGNGVIREITFLEGASLSVLSQHRVERPYGMKGGQPGETGKQWVIRVSGAREDIDGIGGTSMEAGDRFIIHTPGGGGYS